MNKNLEERLSGAAFRGLEHRLVDVPSATSIAVVKAYAAQHARRIRFVRSVRVAFAVTASAAACVALMIGVSRDSGFDRADSVPAGDYDSYLTLTVLTTVLPELDDNPLEGNGMLLSDFDGGTDFDAFSESLLRMQDSACMLDSTVAWN